jgi:hypothetical protein
MRTVDFFSMFFYKNYLEFLYFMNDRSTAACAPFLHHTTSQMLLIPYKEHLQHTI